MIIEQEYRTQFIEHSYIEPEAVVAYPNYNDGIMTVHASAQNPFFTRRYVADILNAPMNKVRLIQETLGGSFGGKEEGVGLVAGRCAYLSKLTKRPVKMVFSRENSFLKSGDEPATGAPVDHVILEEMICHTVKQTDYTAKHAQNREQTADQRFRKGIGLSISYRSCGFGAEAPDTCEFYTFSLASIVSKCTS